MEDILASIKKVIAEEKELRQSGAPGRQEEQEEPDSPDEEDGEEEVLELDEPLAPETTADLGPPLVDESVADKSRHSLEHLSTVAATAPPPSQANPLEEMVREMLRPILKQWLDENLPAIVDEHVKREITRITGRPL